MSVPNKKKHDDYARFAAYCLHLNAPPTDTDADLIEHEMALEWLKLADAALHHPGASEPGPAHAP